MPEKHHLPLKVLPKVWCGLSAGDPRVQYWWCSRALAKQWPWVHSEHTPIGTWPLDFVEGQLGRPAAVHTIKLGTLGFTLVVNGEECWQNIYLRIS